MKFKIEQYAELASTNDTAMSLKPDHGTVIVARTQTQGRGQRGNVWNSEGAGCNLTFSLVIEPTHIPVDEQFAISMMAALAASEAIGTYTPSTIKWPNDIYVGNRKIGGILIEHQLMGGATLSRSVIGVGLNIGQTQFPSKIPNPTSLACEGIGNVTSDDVLDKFLDKFSALYTYDAPKLKSQFVQQLWNATEPRTYRDEQTNEQFTASFHDLDCHTGQLSLRTDTGQIRTYWFKEISIVLNDQCL